MSQQHDYPVRALSAALTTVEADQILADFYRLVSPEQLAQAHSNVSKGLAATEQNPRGELGERLRRHLDIIEAEQQRRGEDAGQ
jgi:hypothetical protein